MLDFRTTDLSRYGLSTDNEPKHHLAGVVVNPGDELEIRSAVRKWVLVRYLSPLGWKYARCTLTLPGLWHHEIELQIPCLANFRWPNHSEAACTTTEPVKIETWILVLFRNHREY